MMHKILAEGSKESWSRQFLNGVEKGKKLLGGEIMNGVLILGPIRRKRSFCSPSRPSGVITKGKKQNVRIPFGRMADIGVGSTQTTVLKFVPSRKLERNKGQERRAGR